MMLILTKKMNAYKVELPNNTQKLSNNTYHVCA